MRSILSNSPYKVQLRMVWRTRAVEFQVLSACKTVILYPWMRYKAGYMDHFMPMFYEE